MTGLDTNILIQLSLKKHSAHVSSHRALAAELQAGHNLALAPSVITEFLHPVTDPRRFTEALSMLESLDWIEQFLRNPQSVQVVFPNAASLHQSLQWQRAFGLGRKRVLDTELAAIYPSAGCQRLITSNPADFQIFKCFELISP